MYNNFIGSSLIAINIDNIARKYKKYNYRYKSIHILCDNVSNLFSGLVILRQLFLLFHPVNNVLTFGENNVQRLFPNIPINSSFISMKIQMLYFYV